MLIQQAYDSAFDRLMLHIGLMCDTPWPHDSTTCHCTTAHSDFVAGHTHMMSLSSQAVMGDVLSTSQAAIQHTGKCSNLGYWHLLFGAASQLVFSVLLLQLSDL